MSQRQRWEKEGVLTHPWAQPCPSSAFSLLMALSLQMCFRGALPPLLPAASGSSAAFPAPKLSQHPHTAEVQLTQNTGAGAVCVQGHVGPGLGILPQRRNPVQSLFLAFP